MKRDSRQQLLDAGVASLHARGFNGCGVQEITETAGVPKGSFYNYFESKEVFSAAVLDQYWDQVARKNLAILSDENFTPLARLKSYFATRAASHAAANFERGCLIGNLASEISAQSKLVRDQLAGLMANWVRIVSGCIREGQQINEIRADIDARTLASFLINAWQGAVQRAKVERDSVSFDDFTTIVFTKLLVNDSAVAAGEPVGAGSNA